MPVSQRRKYSSNDLPVFRRKFLSNGEPYSMIGTGSVGGKAAGLIDIREQILEPFLADPRRNMTVSIPAMTVIGTDVFTQFVEANNLRDILSADMPDERKGMAFMKADFPAEFVGDLRAIVEEVKQPLAIRSSSLLEDEMFRPFAGVYATKMLSNTEPETDKRFRKLVEGIRFVFASTWFKGALDYLKAAGQAGAEEKMAVIIQEVIGKRFTHRFYPHLSGVARSYNFYPFGHAEPEDGIVLLALGLGKTIVDGGRSWPVVPKYARTAPPFSTIRETLNNTQTSFWAVNMDKVKQYDPVNEAEYLVQNDLGVAEYDDTLSRLASTYVAARDRLVIGTGSDGPRVLDFGPLLKLDDYPLAETVGRIMKLCRDHTGNEVEIEFAAVFGDGNPPVLDLNILQVRPMVVSTDDVNIDDVACDPDRALVVSTEVMGNGMRSDITDVVFVDPGRFDKSQTQAMAREIAEVNAALVREQRPYVLIGFGRFGSTDPWLGIPVNYSDIAGARVVVEVSRDDMNVDLSQGSHFFHNMNSLQIGYLSVRHDRDDLMRFASLTVAPVVWEGRFVRHVRLEQPLTICIDARRRRGVIAS